jgi:carboxyl-terminal processing protease
MKRVFNVIFTVVVISTFSSCENIFIEPPKDNPEAVFENIWQTFNEEVAYNTFRPQVDMNTTDDELFTIISEMLQLLNDGHVSLTAPNKHVFYSNRIMRELTDDNLFNKTVIKSYLESDLKTGVEESYIYGKVQGKNVAYIFFDHVAENFAVLNDFLSKYSTVNGYIIDLRHNQGGDFTYCFSEMGRLTNQSRYVFKSKTKNGKERNDYTEWKEWYIHPKGNYVNQPIIVLTDRYTMSATERCVMAFKTLPKVTVIGDTTNGAHGTMIGRALANGWYYSLVPQKVEMYDGNTYEGIGLAPDIFSKNSISEINNGIDMTLQRAIDKLN